jgi:hypothetical protein
MEVPVLLNMNQLSSIECETAHNPRKKYLGSETRLNRILSERLRILAEAQSFESFRDVVRLLPVPLSTRETRNSMRGPAASSLKRNTGGL